MAGTLGKFQRWILAAAAERRAERKPGIAADLFYTEIVRRWFRLSRASRAVEQKISRAVHALERRGLVRCEHGSRRGGGRWAGLVLTAAGLALGRRLPKSRTMLRLRDESRLGSDVELNAREADEGPDVHAALRPDVHAALTGTTSAVQAGFDLEDEEDRALWEEIQRSNAEFEAKERRRKGQATPAPQSPASGRDPRLPRVTRSFTPHRAI